MIVRDNWDRFDARRHKEVHQDRFHLRLTGFEVVSADKHAMLLRQLDYSWIKKGEKSRREYSHFKW